MSKNRQAVVRAVRSRHFLVDKLHIWMLRTSSDRSTNDIKEHEVLLAATGFLRLVDVIMEGQSSSNVISLHKRTGQENIRLGSQSHVSIRNLSGLEVRVVGTHQKSLYALFPCSSISHYILVTAGLL
jgi:hypothetical protein